MDGNEKEGKLTSTGSLPMTVIPTIFAPIPLVSGSEMKEEEDILGFRPSFASPFSLQTNTAEAPSHS